MLIRSDLSVVMGIAVMSFRVTSIFRFPHFLPVRFSLSTSQRRYIDMYMHKILFTENLQCWILIYQTVAPSDHASGWCRNITDIEETGSKFPRCTCRKAMRAKPTLEDLQGTGDSRNSIPKLKHSIQQISFLLTIKERIFIPCKIFFEKNVKRLR